MEKTIFVKVADYDRPAILIGHRRKGKKDYVTVRWSNLACKDKEFPMYKCKLLTFEEMRELRKENEERV